MGEMTEDKVIMQIEKVCNVKYESWENFSGSILGDAYKKAFAITKEIVEENASLNTKGKLKGTERRNSEQIYNILFFTGAKGTGKTSSMLSYMEFLKDYHVLKNSREKKLGEFDFGGDNIMFTGIEPIEVKMVGAKEDILNVVLAKMATKWIDEEKRSYGIDGITQDEDYAYKKRKMQKQFQDIYDCLKDIGSQEDIWKRDSDIYMDTLQKLSFSLNLKKSFQMLVEKYLEIMEYSGSDGRIGNKNRFLVITLDFDEEIEYAYEILEQIRKYLMVPKVIVLMSANYEQLEKICNNHFMEQYKYLKSDNKMENYIRQLSREHLEKIVPVQRQINLKSGCEWGFFDKKEFQITYSNSQGVYIEKSGTLKKIIRNMLNEYFGMQFAVKSRLIDYLAPETLRETASLIAQMGELKIAKNADCKEIENNFTWFYDLELKRVIKKNSRILDTYMVNTLRQLEPDVQCNVFKGLFENEFGEKDRKSILGICSKMQIGKLDSQRESFLCILYLTARLSELFKIISIDSSLEKKQEFSAYFTEGIWGEWENIFLGEVKASADTTNYLTCKISRVEFKVENSALKVNANKVDSYSAGGVKGAIDYLDQNKELFKNYQYLLLFYLLDENISETKNIWKMNPNDQSIELSNACGGVFALSNFVINIFENYPLVKKFLYELSEILCKGNAKNKNRIETYINQNISIMSELENWKTNSKSGLALPLMNVEYLINVGNAISKNFEKAAVISLEQDIIALRIKKYFKILSESLNRYDQIYTDASWKKNFDECPLVKRVLKDDDFMKILINSINLVIIPERTN